MTTDLKAELELWLKSNNPTVPVERLEKALNSLKEAEATHGGVTAAVADDLVEVADILKSVGSGPVYMSHEEFQAYAKDQIEKSMSEDAEARNARLSALREQTVEISKMDSAIKSLAVKVVRYSEQIVPESLGTIPLNVGTVAKATEEEEVVVEKAAEEEVVVEKAAEEVPVSWPLDLADLIK